jgi:hypothetical protein
VTDKFSFAFKSTAIKTKFSNLDYTEQNEIFDVPGFTFLPISDTLCIVDSCFRFFIQDLDFKAHGIFIKYQVVPNKFRKRKLVMFLKKVAFRDNELLTVFGIEKDEYIYSFNLKDPCRSYFRPTRKYEY